MDVRSRVWGTSDSDARRFVVLENVGSLGFVPGKSDGKFRTLSLGQAPSRQENAAWLRPMPR